MQNLQCYLLDKKR